MKIKKTLYKEFNEKFGGLARIKYERQDYGIKYGGWMKMIYNISVMHNRKRDVYYVAITPRGYIDLFEPTANCPTWIIRKDSSFKVEQITEPEHKDEWIPIFEELDKEYRKYLDMSTEEES